MKMNVCTVCKKKFIPAVEHLYKTKDGMQCSYTCWNKAKAKMNFKENEIVICQMGDSFEIGKIKRLCDDGAFVWYHSGDTAAKTPYENIHKIKNAAYLTDVILAKDMDNQWSVGVVTNTDPDCITAQTWVIDVVVTTIKQLAPILLYCSKLLRIVTPTEAMRYYGIRHDEAVNDFLNDLALSMYDGDILDVNSELYKDIYKRMCEDVQ
jgi:hypothetical protein